MFYCNYGPGGNYLGEALYTAANADNSNVAADCPNGDDDGLCL